jgi:pimeloyl-ACP methyl ester carboxylesterase
MPPINLIVFLLNILSVVVLAYAGWLGWTWYTGFLIVAPNGDLVRAREDWRLWLALGLLAWSFLGRFVLLPLLARRDGEAERSRAQRGDGRQIEGHDGASLYVETSGHGAGPTLLFTHGWGLDSTIWGLMRHALADRYQIVAWDLPGLGRSKRGNTKAICLTDFAENLKRVMATVDGPVVLIGHSIGGMTIQTLARDHLEVLSPKVSGIVLLNTTFTNPLKTVVLSRPLQALRWPVIEPVMWLMVLLQPLVWLSAWQGYFSGSAHLGNRLGFGKYVTRTQLDHTALLPTRNSPSVQGRGNRAMFRWDATGALSSLPVPVLVIGGELDIVTKPEASRTIAASSPGAELEVVEGVNHMGFLERSDIYAQAIDRFVARLPRTARAMS